MKGFPTQNNETKYETHITHLVTFSPPLTCHVLMTTVIHFHLTIYDTLIHIETNSNINLPKINY